LPSPLRFGPEFVLNSLPYEHTRVAIYDWAKIQEIMPLRPMGALITLLIEQSLRPNPGQMDVKITKNQLDQLRVTVPNSAISRWQVLPQL